MINLLGYAVVAWVAWPLTMQAQAISAAISVSTLAGSAEGKGKASTDGTGIVARFDWPMGIAVAANGTVYVTDTYQHTIREITPAGVVTTLAGGSAAPGSQDGPGAAARFQHPVGLAVASSGLLYVADVDNQLIHSVTPHGLVRTLAGAAGSRGSAVAADGAPYVAADDNQLVRKITAAGAVTTLGGTPGKKGFAEGPTATARFHAPTGVAVAASGTFTSPITSTPLSGGLPRKGRFPPSPAGSKGGGTWMAAPRRPALSFRLAWPLAPRAGSM